MVERKKRSAIGIRWDEGKRRYRVSYKDGDGKWRREHAGRTFEAAKRKLPTRKRQVREGTLDLERDAGPNVTLAGYVRRWEAQQAVGKRRNVEREARQLRLHALPTLGRRPVNSITPPDILRLCWSCYEPDEQHRRTRGKLGEKSVHNLKGVLSSVFSLAVFEGVMDRNPCAQIPRGKLPKIGKQKRPLYDREEARALMTDPRIPPDRRMFHTLQGLTGLRVGEVAGLRWRDYDPRTRPLGALHVHCQYDGQPLKTASGADTKARMVPVHPELARVLSEWRLEGFAEVYLRQPTEEDFIVPDRRNMGARTPSQVTKAPDHDCAAVGIADKGTHAFRRYFITYARADGASPDVLERFTHNRRGEIIDVYTSFEWPTLCRAVRCLKVDLERGKRLDFGPAADRVWDTFLDTEVDPGRNLNDFNPKLVEAVGIKNI
ncbi:MAG: site-specific integrase [Myxococcales bacterium]|nr:site-specific integrase [Myxococcales bacterium]